MKIQACQYLGIALICTITCLQVPARSQDKYLPEHTTVAIVPIVNSGGEKNDGFRTKQTESGNAELVKEFTERGFQPVSSDAVNKAVADLKIDLTDEEQQKRENLYKIGKAVNADLVVFAVITDTAQQFHVGVFTNSREGRAKIKLWLLDVKNEKPILSAVVKEGKSGGSFFAGLDVGSTRIIIAVANGERDALAKLLSSPTRLLRKMRSKRLLSVLCDEGRRHDESTDLNTMHVARHGAIDDGSLRVRRRRWPQKWKQWNR